MILKLKLMQISTIYKNEKRCGNDMEKYNL